MSKHSCEECGGMYECIRYAGNWYCRAHYFEILQPKIRDFLKKLSAPGFIGSVATHKEAEALLKELDV